MLDISKIEAGKSEEFTLFPTEIKKALWQIRDDFISIASEKHISLIWDIDIPDSTVILLPTDRYRQAIINLIGNALKFTPQDGSVTLQASMSKKWLTVSVIDT
jgi:signal transduction histidine kinase